MQINFNIEGAYNLTKEVYMQNHVTEIMELTFLF